MSAAPAPGPRRRSARPPRPGSPPPLRCSGEDRGIPAGLERPPQSSHSSLRRLDSQRQPDHRRLRLMLTLDCSQSLGGRVERFSLPVGLGGLLGRKTWVWIADICDRRGPAARLAMCRRTGAALDHFSRSAPRSAGTSSTVADHLYRSLRPSSEALPGSALYVHMVKASFAR